MSDSRSAPIRVAIFEDSAERRLGLKYLIGMVPDMLCVGLFEDARNAVQDVLNCKPDVVLMDIGMPEVSGIEAVKSIKLAKPEIIILMQTIFDQDAVIFEAIKAGASGYLLKKSPPNKVIEGIQEAANGGGAMSPAIAMKLIAFFQKDALAKPDLLKANKYGLTERELEILTSLVEGRNYKMTAAHFNITYHTVNTHVRRIYEKLHVHSLGEAISKTMKEGLV